MYLSIIKNRKWSNIYQRLYSCSNNSDKKSESNKFEPVFSFPTISYIAIINRLKVYHIIGTSVAIPSTGIMEVLNVIPTNTFLSTVYVGLTGAAVLSLVTLPFRNIIGHLYISENNREIKISFLDFWGKRNDRIVKTEEWIPLLDLTPKLMDAFFLSPTLTDGTKFILPVKFGRVLNSQKMGEVLE